ncbi:type II toxin-antitoxin system VapC family toxin [Dyadobacter chenwenxiniae]|uniref:Type II toxin-antitoxin system VapC family toxin n=1 Tax=Dyadobacter chenwenxiniae TaxID=2906456 RepID=A0A9X1PR63_9BACT|nr:type II toxin-antitoxin system VapC family toxin [Dyadobacter chenwenxiniae]MCF0065513.1 type II toxin-antitoxin system VapC family toxin [Dyadobacter chenwenxiniae]UON82080.1 type II toxin-antitoxin system VapC family toxin [Dyadobacter chenwenxiniae]
MGRYLIDTQILIWSLISPDKLGLDVLKRLSSEQIYTSQLSLLEIAIKQKINKLPELQISIEELEPIIVRDGFQIIPLKTKHIIAYKEIPLYANHRDPFDRLLLATAYAENIAIISADLNFKLYSDFIQLIEA